MLISLSEKGEVHNFRISLRLDWKTCYIYCEEHFLIKEVLKIYTRRNITVNNECPVDLSYAWELFPGDFTTKIENSQKQQV